MFSEQQFGEFKNLLQPSYCGSYSAAKHFLDVSPEYFSFRLKASSLL